jgi:hypothetical protein
MLNIHDVLSVGTTAFFRCLVFIVFLYLYFVFSYFDGGCGRTQACIVVGILALVFTGFRAPFQNITTV